MKKIKNHEYKHMKKMSKNKKPRIQTHEKNKQKNRNLINNEDFHTKI